MPLEEIGNGVEFVAVGTVATTGALGKVVTPSDQLARLPPSKAITEPVNVMAPMATPSDISSRLAPAMLPGVPMPKASGA